MKCVSNRKQLEDEKRRRETIEREKEQMLREKEELLVRLQEYEVKTQKAEKGKVLVLADQITDILGSREGLYGLPKFCDTGITWQDLLISACTDKCTNVHPKYESSIKTADLIWEPKGRNSVFSCCQEDLSRKASSSSEQEFKYFLLTPNRKSTLGTNLSSEMKLMFQCTEEHIGSSDIWSMQKTVN